MIGVITYSEIKSHFLTAGSAKKEIPSMAEKAAISFPAHVVGTTSPYPTVHSVIYNHNDNISMVQPFAILES